MKVFDVLIFFTNIPSIELHAEKNLMLANGQQTAGQLITLLGGMGELRPAVMFCIEYVNIMQQCATATRGCLLAMKHATYSNQ